MFTRAEWTRTLPGRADIRRILVIKWSALGDIVIASALFEDIRQAFPGCAIHLNTLPAWADLFAHAPCFDRIIAMPVRGIRAIARWLHAVRSQRYDLIIDLQSNDRSRLLMTLLQLSGCGARYRLGTHRRFPYNIAPATQSPDVHAFMHLRAALHAGGIATPAAGPVLYPGPAHRARAMQIMSAHNLSSGCYALLMPGCKKGGELKRWGARRYIALAVHLHDAGMERIVLVGAADDRDVCARIAACCGDWVINLCEATTILDIVPLCEQAACIVSNDTGTAHVAAVSDRPMVVVCGPTDPRRVKPVGDRVIALQAGIYCVNCYRKECTHHACMALISPEAVFDSLVAAKSLTMDAAHA